MVKYDNVNSSIKPAYFFSKKIDKQWKNKIQKMSVNIWLN